MSRARELSEELRHGEGKFLACRRGVVALSLTTISSMGLIALYQMGILRRLPEPPLALFNTRKVNASPEAYSKLNLPDAVLGLGSYAATLGLAAMGGEDRAETQPWIPLALVGKALVDAAQAGKLTHDSWTKHGAFCIYSLVAATATFATLPLVFPEAWAATKSWKLRCGKRGLRRGLVRRRR